MLCSPVLYKDKYITLNLNLKSLQPLFQISSKAFQTEQRIFFDIGGFETKC